MPLNESSIQRDPKTWNESSDIREPGSPNESEVVREPRVLNVVKESERTSNRERVTP